jgi:hypothetical protein
MTWVWGLPRVREDGTGFKGVWKEELREFNR